MPILIPIVEPVRRPGVQPRAAPVLTRRSAATRAFALVLTMTLALFLVLAAGHRHDSQAGTGVCAVCAVLSNEMPCTGALPALVASTVAHAYVLMAVPAYACWYRRPALTPPSRGPPCMPPRPRVRYLRLSLLRTITRFICNTYDTRKRVRAAAACRTVSVQRRACGRAPPMQAPRPRPPTRPAQPIQTVQVTAAHLKSERIELSPKIGTTVYTIDQHIIEGLRQGADTPFNEVLLRLPGVDQDSKASGSLHVRDEHGNVQYRINGVQLPESISGFGQSIDTRLIDQIDFMTGALPAQYGLRTAGIVDIQTKEGVRVGRPLRRAGRQPRPLRAERRIVRHPGQPRATTCPAAICATTSASRIRSRPATRCTTTPSQTKSLRQPVVLRRRPDPPRPDVRHLQRPLPDPEQSRTRRRAFP